MTVEHLQFIDGDAFMVGVAVLMEAGADWFSVGGNQVRINGGVDLDDEQRAELDKLTVHAVPALDGAPVAAEPQTEFVPATQVATLAAAVDTPPRTGPGATRDAWSAWADQNKVPYPEGASRDEIIAAVDAARSQEAPGDS